MNNGEAHATYHSGFVEGRQDSYPLGKIVCVGRNYAEHAKELNNPIPSEAILFIKPESSAISITEPIVVPEGDCHYETELSILIGSSLSRASEAQVENAIVGLGLALDLTRRDLQTDLKSRGLPWEIAKSFDGACPLSNFVMPEKLGDLNQLVFSLHINGELRQLGRTADMLTPVVPLIAFMSQHFTLKPGDVILTGTPKGVGKLQSGDQLKLKLADKYVFKTVVE